MHGAIRQLGPQELGSCQNAPQRSAHDGGQHETPRQKPDEAPWMSNDQRVHSVLLT